MRGAERTPVIGRVGQTTGLDTEQLITFSAETGEGRDELAAALIELLEQPSWRVA